MRDPIDSEKKVDKPAETVQIRNALRFRSLGDDLKKL